MLAAQCPVRTVEITSQPHGQVCTLTNESGIVPATDVTNIGVNCTVGGYFVSGLVSGLASSVGFESTGSGCLKPSVVAVSFSGSGCGRSGLGCSKVGCSGESTVDWGMTAAGSLLKPT